MDNSSVHPDELKGFNKYANYVGNLLTYNLPMESVKGTQKLIVEFLSEKDAFFVFPKNLGEPMYTIRETFPFNEFSDTLTDKLKLITEKAYECLIILYKHLKLNPANLDIGYKKIRESDYTLSVSLCGGLKHNRNRTRKAILTAEYFLEYAIIYVCVLDKENRVTEKINLFKTMPHYLFYSHIIHSAKWIDNEIFQISNRSKEIKINVNVNKKVDVEYFPQQRDIEGVKEEIRFFTLERMIDIG